MIGLLGGYAGQQMERVDPERNTPESALKAANDLCVGAKGYSP